jgi:hypothetical protein
MTVKLSVLRYGNFGERLQLSACVDGVEPNNNSDILNISYRDNVVAWVFFPIGSDKNGIIEAVRNKADYYLGSRCPDMENHPLEFK